MAKQSAPAGPPREATKKSRIAKRGAAVEDESPEQSSADGLPQMSDETSSGNAQLGDANGRTKRTKLAQSATIALQATTRGVANLTPEQLAKKRFNDREAQRAIRERTKNQIDSLERHIRDLTSQPVHQELQNVIRLKGDLEAENDDLKRRLASIMGILDPVFRYPNPPPLNGAHMPPMPMPYMAPQALSVPMGHPASSLPSPVAHDQHSRWEKDHPILPTPIVSRPLAQPTMSPSWDPSGARSENGHAPGQTKDRHGLDFLMDRSTKKNLLPPIRDAQDTGSNSSSGSNINGSWKSDPGALHAPYAPPSNGETCFFAAPIKNCQPSCNLDSILMNFLHERRALAATTPISILLGPAYPSMAPLLDSNLGIGAHPMSKVFLDILTTHPAISQLPEKVAAMYIMFLIMRWQIVPSLENYERLPLWATPRPSQLMQPHPPWIDYVPFPAMRDRLIRDQVLGENLFERFASAWGHTLSLNWPHAPEDVLQRTSAGDPEAGGYIINPVFERHLRNIDNWTLGETFSHAFPNLEGTYGRTRSSVSLR